MPDSVDTAAQRAATTPDVPPATHNGRRTGRAFFYPGVTDAEWNDWKWQFKNRVTTLDELVAKLPIPPHELGLRKEVLSDFRMGITPYYLSLIDQRYRAKVDHAINRMELRPDNHKEGSAAFFEAIRTIALE